LGSINYSTLEVQLAIWDFTDPSYGTEPVTGKAKDLYDYGTSNPVSGSGVIAIPIINTKDVNRVNIFSRDIGIPVDKN